MESLKLITNKKDLFLFSTLLSLIFFFNLIYKYQCYKDFVKEELYEGNFQVINIYDKEKYKIIKVHNNNFEFFTSIDKNINLRKLDNIKLAVLSTKIDFLDFLRGFYTKTVYFEYLSSKNSIKKIIYDKIENSHINIEVKELFNALFLAIPISKEYRGIYTDFGISHLIAISGFHLGIISFVIYWLIYFPYSLIHKKFYIYRNKRADVLFLTMSFLLYYLYLTNIVPSLLRAFVMFLIGVLFLRANIKVVSYETLLITFLIIVSIFPNYIFSISFWFSISGVFYIFLYLQYFNNLPKIVSFLFFNFWIFMVFNPIVHFFFYNTAIEQFISPFLTLFFTIFYPLEIVLHLIGYADILDSYILYFLNYNISTYEIKTPLWFFILFVILSISSIKYKNAFKILNIKFLLFNLYMYI